MFSYFHWAGVLLRVGDMGQRTRLFQVFHEGNSAMTLWKALDHGR